MGNGGERDRTKYSNLDDIKLRYYNYYDNMVHNRKNGIALHP
jgi:hypothetical protein